MKIKGNFIDHVYANHQNKIGHQHKISSREFAFELINKLPDRSICDLASILIIETKSNYHAVKIRWYYEDRNGNIDFERIYKKIYDSDFIKISWRDFKDVENVRNRVEELIGFGNNVLFDFEGLE